VKYSKNPLEKLRHATSLVGLRKKQVDLDIFTPWIDLEKRFGFHSTFFFFGTKISRRHMRDDVYTWDDPVRYKGKRCRLREVVRDIHAQGWYLGLHSSFLSARDENLMREQKEDLENVLGSQVYSIRQHNLHHDVSVTPLLEDRVGFQVGCTQGFNRDVGFRSGIAYPCRSYDLKEKRWLGILQIPLVLQDGALMRQDNLDLSETGAIKLGKKLIDRVKETKGVISLLWHPNTVVQPSWWRVYEELLKYIHEQNGWGASAKEIRDWWVGQGLLGRMEKVLGSFETSPLPSP
jgi:peptidoglycan/xylan/chitin deacetylase (PgdA/CDA1 family)